MTRPSNALLFLTPAPNSRDTNGSLVPRRFGRRTFTGQPSS
jgi:hypothetical protein